MPRPPRPLDCVLIKPAGPDCNLRCRYCFYLDRRALFPAPPPHRMSPAVLERTVQQVMRSAGPRVAFGWQGGEPTLLGVEFFRQAVELQQRCGRAGQLVGNGLQTNGLLLDDRWCRFLRSARFLVGLSFDGPQAWHDRYRRAAGGRPSWARVDQARQRLLDAGVAVNALTVLTDVSAAHPRELYDFLKARGLHHMQFIPCLEPDPRDPARPAEFSVAPDRLGTFLCTVFDCWLDDFRSGRPTTSVRWFESVFATYAGAPPAECALLPECGTYLVIEHNGDVFACDFYVEPAWRLGNVLHDDLAALHRGPAHVRFGRRKAALPRACQACRWLVHCRGGCPRERWGHPAGDGRSFFCDAYRAFFAHTDERWLALAAARRRALPASLPGAPPPPRMPRPPRPPAAAPSRAGRNAPCPCGSGAKYKHCCGR